MSADNVVSFPGGSPDPISPNRRERPNRPNRPSEAAKVDGAELLMSVDDWLGRFVSYPHADAHTAHTLWIAHTWLVDQFDNTPRIAFLSPEPGSGKSRALEVTEPLLADPVITVNASPSYVFRRIKVEDGQPMPTLLIDECDAIFSTRASTSSEELRGLLNSGYRRGATAGRARPTKDDVITEDWPSFAPVALAGLNQLPDTLMTRSIVVNMKRRKPGETVSPYRRRIYKNEAAALREQLAAWAAQVRPTIADTWPQIPDSIQDRDADVWEPILQVADAAGGAWPKIARQAAVRMVADQRQRPETLGIKLLSDIRKIMADTERISTVDLLGRLIAIDTSPWAAIHGEPIDSRFLARTLSKYDVPTNNTMKIDGRVVKGYARHHLVDAWERYLPTPSPQIGNSGNQGNLPAANGPDVTEVTEVTDSHRGYTPEAAVPLAPELITEREKK